MSNNNDSSIQKGNGNNGMLSERDLPQTTKQIKMPEVKPPKK